MLINGSRQGLEIQKVGTRENVRRGINFRWTADLITCTKNQCLILVKQNFWKEWHRLIEGTGTHLKAHVTLTPGVERFGTIAVPIIYIQLYSTCNNWVIQHFSLYVPREFWRNLGTELWRNWLIIEGPTEHLWHTSTQRPRKRRRLREGLASWIN